MWIEFLKRRKKTFFWITDSLWNFLDEVPVWLRRKTIKKKIKKSPETVGSPNHTQRFVGILNFEEVLAGIDLLAGHATQFYS